MLDVLLQDELSYVNVLCFTEHRQRAANWLYELYVIRTSKQVAK
jgi:hypothetical protein